MAYSEKHIQVLSAIDGIRKKASLYIGNVDELGILHLIQELIDNAVDEYSAGKNSHLKVHVSKDKKTITVADAGRGIPVGNKRINGKVVSTLTAIFTQIHAGGKFDIKSAAYAGGARGTHGIGVTACNALSSKLQVWTCREWQWYSQKFERGEPLSNVVKTKLPDDLPFKPPYGTIVRLTPDQEIFKKHVIPQEKLAELLALTSFLHKGLRIELVLNTGKSKTWYNAEGLSAYLEWRLGYEKAKPDGPSFLLETKDVKVLLQWSTADGNDGVLGYTNGLNNSAGGLHVQRILDIVVRELNKYKTNRVTCTAADIREGLLGLVNVNLNAPQFSSQTKEKLIDPRTNEIIDGNVVGPIVKFFAKNKTFVKQLLQRATELNSARMAYRNDKAVAKALKNTTKGRNKLPVNLAASTGRNPKDNELFIVEGDSAGGTAKYARDPRNQEVLMLGGKIINVMKAKDINAALVSEKILDILRAIGYDPAKKNPLDNLRVSKIVCLADKDSDGDHINALLLTLFSSVLRPLFAKGMICVARGYEFIGKKGNMVYYGDSVNDVRKQAGNAPISVQHIKGWGEIPPEILRTMAFDPKTRILLQMKELSDKHMARIYDIMGEDVACRRKLLRIDAAGSEATA